MKKLSIIIPVYNVEAYVIKCIRSVKENNLPESDYEIIIVDDESPDNSVALIQQTFPNDPSIQIISQKNKGLGGARNTGIKAAQGKYLLFLDSDDVLVPNSLSELLTFAEMKNVEILEFGAQGVDLNHREVYTFHNTTKGKVLNGVEYYNTVRYMNSACNKLYKREFLTENQLFFLERIFIEDFEFNTRVFYNAKRVAAISRIGAHFLQSENSITRNTNTEKKKKMVEDILQVLRITHFLFLKSNSNDLEEKIFFRERLGFLLATLFFQKAKNKSSYLEVKQLKEELESEGVYYVDYPLFQRSKNIFRILILKNISLYKLIRPFL